MQKNVSLNVFKEAKRAFCAIRRTQKTALYNSQGEFAWICDNMHLIDKAYLGIQRLERRACKKFLIDKLQWLCEQKSYALTERDVTGYLSENSAEFELTAGSVYAVPSLIDLCVLKKLSKICLLQKDRELLQGCITTLRFTSSIEADALFDAAYLPEKIFKAFEKDYALFDDATKNSYRMRLQRLAFKKHCSEISLANAIASKASIQNEPFGNLLFENENSGNIAIYIVLFIIALAIALLGFYVFGPWAVLCVLSVIEGAFAVADLFVSLKKSKPTKRLLPSEITGGAKTVIAITTLLFGEQKDKEIFDRLSQLAASNKDKNVVFCLLADLADAKQKTMPEDEAIARYAKTRIDDLCKIWGDRFCIYLRERQYSKKDDVWRAHERKRGAICELVRLLSGEKTGGSIYGNADLGEVKYICTLDRDTHMPIGALNELLGAALHPMNRPCIKNGRVIKGYGIIQPAIRTDLEAAYRTYFSRLISGEPGNDAYESVSFDRSTAIFGEGTFCGKGLINVEVFYNTVINAVPDGVILSHDIVEGEIARTLFVPETVFYDDCPKTPGAFCKRMHRWIRGDMQNIVMLGKSEISCVGKYKILSNIRRALTNVLSALALIACALFIRKNAFLYLLLSLSHLIIPFLLSVISTLVSGGAFTLRRYFTRSLTALSQATGYFLWSCVFVPVSGYISADAAVRALFRLFSGKRTLEWTTSMQAEGMTASIIPTCVSLSMGVLLLPFTKTLAGVLAAALFLCYPISEILLSKRLAADKKTFSKSDRQFLLESAKEMWRFFENRVGADTKHLPPDNIQYSPEMRTAMRTSPTNIGFYLVSVLAARDLGFISTDEMAERILQTLNTVKGLKRYRSCLYNWYDLSTTMPLGDYVSSVDCGNCFCCLIALRMGLYEYLGESKEKLMRAIELCDDEIKSTDLGIFYDHKKHLFSLGISALTDKPDMSCYDLYMSEFRLTAYAAVAFGFCDKRSWQRLGRMCTTQNGYIGMLSWSGTAFEYFLPSLFLPEYKNSFLSESLSFAFMMQRSKAKNKMFGISESGYYAFDSAMNYAYKAHGIQEVALCTYQSGGFVYAPYAAYLMLCTKEQSVIGALKAFAGNGMKGEYGLYEANDYIAEKDDGLIVRSFMSHHVGMSIIACANACRDDIFIKRFVSDHHISSSLELLKERVPPCIAIYDRNSSVITRLSDNKLFKPTPTGNFSLSEPEFALLSGNGVSAICSSSGHVRMLFGKSMLNICDFNRYELLPSVVIRFCDQSGCFGCAPLHGEGNYSGELGTKYVSQINSSQAFTGKTVIRAGRARPGFFFETSADNRKKYSITLCFEPSLDKMRDFDSHPAYSRLFVEGYYDAEQNALIFKRRSAKGVQYLVAAIRDKHIAFEFTTSKECINANGLSTVSDIDSIIPDSRVGACISPLCLIRTTPIRGGKTCFIVTAGETLEAALSNLAFLRIEAKCSAANEPTGDIMSFCLRKCCMPRQIKAFAKLPKADISALWQHGISGDRRLILLEAFPHTEKALSDWIAAYAAMIRGFLEIDLAICIDESDNYNRPLEKFIRRLCVSNGLEGYINSGIFLPGSMTDELKMLADIHVNLSKCALPVEDGTSIASVPHIRRSAGDDIKSDVSFALPTAEGGFTEDAYVIDTTTAPPLPRTLVLANKNGFGAVITHSSLGYTFDGNAREKRITYHSCDPHSGLNGEILICRIGSEYYDLCACAKRVSFFAAHAAYEGSLFGYAYKVTVVIDSEINAKIIDVHFDDTNKFEVALSLLPCSPDGISQNTNTAAAKDECGFWFENIPSRRAQNAVFVGADNARLDTDLAHFMIGERGASDRLIVSHTSSTRFIIASADQKELSALRKKSTDAICLAADIAATEFIPNIKAKLQSKTLTALMGILPIQTGVCRLLARASFWQAGGAYGFRDQLQDCMMLAYSVPEKAKNHILSAASHQYIEGDVMHWWHEGIGGVRTKCSDDMLWLPIATGEYIRITGDEAILDERICFLSSEPLGNKKERYEAPDKTKESFSLREHCLRALDVTETGTHGLALMGSCDWNDAFSEMLGESMLTTFIYIVAAKAFLPFAGESAGRISARAAEMLQSTERHYSDGRYIRAIAGDGKIYGKKGSDECAIDAAVQAFAVFAGAKNGRNAVENAYNLLAEDGVLKLLSPPFDNGRSPAGVIRRYPPGIRENGGQYTHAAVWLAIAAFESGLCEIGKRITKMLDPISKNLTKSDMQRYKGEPYVLSADIYTAVNAFGRAGWSWYTGSAGWYYKLLLEHYMGIKLCGDTIDVVPNTDFSCVITKGECTLEIIASDSADGIFLDGESICLPIKLQKGKHTLTLKAPKQTQI